jgi:iron complex outermembrane receptor protein
MPSVSHINGCLLAWLLSAATSVDAREYPEPELIDEIIVVAQKREQGIQSVGVSVTAFAAGEIREFGFINSIDIVAQTPNVSFGDGAEGLANILNIRGVSQNDFSLHQESAVAVYVDEAYLSFNSAQQFQLFDLERVEVLRGPQGTLFGRNATGGLIHYISKKPGADFDASLSAEIGEQGLWRVEGAVGGPLGKRVSGRLAAVSYGHDDFVTNLGPGGDFRGREEYGVRGALLIEPSDRTDVLLSVSHSRSDLTFGYIHRSVGFDDDGRQFLVPADVDFWGTGPGNDVVGFQAPADSYTANTGTAGYFEPEMTSFTARISYELEAFSLTSVTNLLSFAAPFREDSDISPRDGLLLDAYQDNDQWSQEFNLQGVKGDVLWLLGAFFMDRDVQANTAFISYTPYLDDFAAGFGITAPGDILAGYGDDVITISSDWRLKTRTSAVFAQTELGLSETLSATLGLRYSSDDLDYRFDSLEDLGGVELDPASQFWGATNYAMTEDDGDWSAKAQLDWTPREHVLGYFGISRGTKGAGFNAPFTGGTVNPFNGEVLTNYELGFKSTLLDGRATLNGSLFHFEYDDYQAFAFENISATISNIDASATGLELEMKAHLLGAFELSLGVGYLDSKIKQGGELPLAPDWSVNGLLRKGWNVGGDNTIVAQADFNWAGAFYTDSANNTAGLVGSQHALNARISYEHHDGKWAASLVGRNLTDEENLYSMLPVSTSWAQAYYGRPRWISVEFTFNY